MFCDYKCYHGDAVMDNEMKLIVLSSSVYKVLKYFGKW